MKIPGKLAINTIKDKLPMLDSDQLTQLNNSISLSPSSVVAVDTKKLASPITDKSFSIRLRKWVEPYNIGGIDYSLFYTEVDHNFKVGNRVFIEGGVYDSDAFILRNKYKKNVDGYKVLYVDRCKVVLDIEYTGDLPTNEEEIDNFIKVYVASTQEEFEYYSQIVSMRDDIGIIHNRFDSQPGSFGTNNFLFLNGTFSITPPFYGLSSFATNFTPSSTSTNLGNSFVVRGTASNSNLYFVDITTDVLTNNITQYLNPGYTQSLSGFYNNGKIRIMNGNFDSGNTKFKNEYIYYFDTVDSVWKVDKSYLPTLITEQHFRRGVFKKGSYNQGLYGQHEERIKYNGDNIKWNLGSTLNVDWESGVLDSTVFKNDSSFSIFDRFEVPQIRANAANNGGAGYNYIFNTDFTGGDVINGNIFNMAVLYGTNSATQSAIEDYITGQQSNNYSINIKGGVYYNSDIIFASVSNSTLISSYVFNSVLNKVKSVNSEIENSVFLNGTWISDKIVKIQSYEESNILWYNRTSQSNYKMYKFYLTDTNWLRLREFQNFYFQDLGINIPSDEILNFFDDKFSIGQYQRTIDDNSTGGKFTQSVFIQLSTKEENRNSPGVISSGGTVSMSPNDNALPSIDLFIEGGDDFVYGTSSAYPRPFIADTIDISKAYILDSDFISGLFKGSKWVTGNYINYNSDYSFVSTNGYMNSYNSTTNELKFTTSYPKYRHEILGTGSLVQPIVFVNGLYYDSTLNSGQNIVKLSDTYKISSFNTNPTNNEFYLTDVFTQSGNLSMPTFTNQQYIRTINAKNRWNYLHPVKFQDSIIMSGIFRRAYFDGCQFNNTDISLTDRELNDVVNARKMLLSDIIFSDNNNQINSGLVQYSHFTSGSDSWNNGTLHKGIWDTTSFTYSIFGSTSSVIRSSGNNTFKNGVFRNSTWVNGIFDNGLFYRNNTNLGGTISVYDDTLQVYYIDNPINFLETRYSWQKGIFNNGDFEKSNFESGSFLSGNFFDSNFFTGESKGGNFGKSNIPYSNTRVWSGTFSNINVISAEFRTADPTTPVPGSSQSINWKDGVFNSGIFGVTIDPSTYSSTYPWSAEWQTGIFNNGEFTDIAYWKDGTFNNGKFTSYYGLFSGQFPTPFQYTSYSIDEFAWQNGKFNDGEFGTGLTGNNSTWYSGEFNGGKFQGRYWKDGILTRGQFLGSATYSTDMASHNRFINGFNSHYYGFWQDGFVSKNKDKFITNEKLYTEIERISTKKKKKPDTLFRNVLWNSGTFSNFDAEMNNSVWLDGTFQDGYFSDSTFNPYINLANPTLLFETVGGSLGGFTPAPVPTKLLDVYTHTPITALSFALQTLSVEPGRTYTLQVEVLENTGVQICFGSTTNIVAQFNQVGILSGTRTATTTNLVIFFVRSSPGDSIKFRNVIIYPGTQSGFRTTDSCIWENGEAYSSDFHLSKWNQGVFDSYATSSQGNAWGIIWKDGITKYMNANNVLWEAGLWRNGNWNGSPFIETLAPICRNVVLNGSFGTTSNWNINYYDLSGFGGSAAISGGSFNYTENDHGGPAPFGDNLSTLVQTGILSIGQEYTIILSISNNQFATVLVDAGQTVVGSGAGNGTFSISFTASSVDLSLEINTDGPDSSANGWTISIDNIIVKFCTGGSTIVYPGFNSDIINNIMLYGSQSFSNSFSTIYNNWDQLHLNDVFTQSGGLNVYDPFINNDIIPMSQVPAIGSTISLPTNVLYIDNTTLYVNNNTEFLDSSYWVNDIYGDQDTLIFKDIYNGQYIYADFTSPFGGGGGATLSQLGILTPGETYNVVANVTINLGTFSNLQIVSGSTYINFGTPNQTGIITQQFVAEDADFKLWLENSTDQVWIQFDSIMICKKLKTRYGNGQFLSGIWENGVWNEGWREDLTTITCDNLSNFVGVSKNMAYKTNIWTWLFTLNVLNVGAQSSGLITDFRVGDKVSVGNIVTIDINGNRRLIRDYLTIISIDYNNITNSTSLTLEVNVNFPIRSIERDSESHLIYISRNVWLNGVFLNGRFLGGVWNNGLFKGFPYITRMEDSQWIDGIFKGGRFSGSADNYINDLNLTVPYHTGLIQKFDFYDENVSGQPYEFKYNSWIDVNYYVTEGVNINRINNVYKQTSLGFTASFIENNFYGYPTVDVLESNSTLRNGFDLNNRSYKLGWKWREYTNFLEDTGQFIDINELTYTNFNNTSSGFGVDNLINDGWTFSNLTAQEGFASATNSIVSNIGNYESEWLYLTGGRRSPQQLPFSDNINFTVDIFDNTNIEIDSLRYSFIEIEAETLNFTQSVSGVVQPVVFYNNYPATYSIAAINTLFNGSNITIPINQIATASVINQREYFFNKTDLKMIIFSGPTYSIRFKKIRFVETDMIPFAQIASDCILFKTNALWDTTPPVDNPTTPDPTPFAYPYPGQWELAQPTSLGGNLQLVPGAGEPTWDNFYLVFGGVGCASYINEDVNIPYVAKAPDIDYDSSNFSYLKSANVTITDVTGQ